MKATIRFILVFLFSSVLLFTSCRKEETELIETPPEDTLEANSTLANLMQRTASNDGSNDNILDLANCFNIKLPVTVTANSINVNVNEISDYYQVESIFDEEYDDNDALDIAFPITIIKSDFSELTVNSMSELTAMAATCNGENIIDNDIECIDFIYPISASLFNTNNELLSTEVFSTDNELYSFIDTIVPEDIVTINFPISVELFDESQFQINSMSELQDIIEDEQDSCDEDDDFDYNDDDCDNCTPELLEDFLTGCGNWRVDKLKKSSVNYDTAYEGYDFNFFTDGTLSVFWNTTTVYGTWSISGTGNNMTVLIDIPALPLCNNNWDLQEINNTGLTKIDFRINTVDRLRYRNTCN